MRRLQIELLAAPPSSWRWRVYDADTQKILRSGSAESREGALSQANRAKHELDSQVGID